MKVLIISRGVPTLKAPLNGIFEWDQAVALASQGVDVAYLALDFRKITHRRKWGVHTYTRQGIKVFELSLPTGVYRRALPLLQRWCYVLYKKVQQQWGMPDVMHTHFYFMGAIAANLSALTGVPLVHTEHSSKLNKPIMQVSKLDKRLATKAFNAADTVLAVSTAYAAVLERNFGVKAQVVPNVLALSSTTKSAGTLASSENHTSFTWVSVGRLVPSKGMAQLLSVFRQALQEQPNMQLWIIGDGPQKASLQVAIANLHLQDSVKLLGSMPRSQVQSYLTRAQAFVLLSESETFGVSYVEAMANGLPVLATQCGGPNDFVHKGNGVIVPVGDTPAAVQAMVSMVQQYNAYHSTQIAQEVVNRFSAKTIANRLQEIYQQTLQHARY